MQTAKNLRVQICNLHPAPLYSGYVILAYQTTSGIAKHFGLEKSKL